MPEYRRILLDGACVQVRRDGEELVAGDGRRVAVSGAVHLPPMAQMQWDMHYLVADIARTITLYPGDVLLLGTPANSRPVQPGDLVEVGVAGLGRLASHPVAGPTEVPAEFGAQPTASEEVISTALGGDRELRGIRPPMRA